jgi:hypothetical protein
MMDEERGVDNENDMSSKPNFTCRLNSAPLLAAIFTY